MRTFATEKVVSKFNSKLLWGGAAIAAAGFLLGEYNQAEGVDYKKLRVDIEDLIESAFQKQPMYDDGSFGPLLVRLAWHSSGTYSK